jgi:hypothetical protein
MAQKQFLPSPLRRPQRNECAAVKVALRRHRDALTSGAWLCWWFTSSWEELPSLTVIRAYVRPCALRRDK